MRQTPNSLRTHGYSRKRIQGLWKLAFCAMLFAPIPARATPQHTDTSRQISLTETPEKPRNTIYKGFSGGMFFHSGYLKSHNFPVYGLDGSLLTREQIKGMPTGIGGVIRFHLGNHWRIGSEGYGTQVRYGEHRSQYKIGWGGVLVDYAFPIKRWTPYLGLTIGGGKAHHLVLTQETGANFTVEEGSLFREYPLFIINPFIGLEYTMTSKLHLILKADWMLKLNGYQSDFPTGPRIYIGIVFYRLSN